jgi:hypothetical protein
MYTGFSFRKFPGKGDIRRLDEMISLGARMYVVSSRLEFLNMFPDSHPGDSQMLAKSFAGDKISIFTKYFE